jgi:Flp pilus assembly protein TadB
VTTIDASDPQSPSAAHGQQRPPGWAVLFVLVVLVFFGVLAMWGVAAATITAVAIAVVTVVPVILRALTA